MKHSSEAGFTLIELLVGMALIGIVLASLLNFFTQGSQVSAQSSSRAELQQEILTAQQLIAGKLKAAWYIYPPNQALALASSDAPTVRNPVTLNQNWTTGTHPILAMILPPIVTPTPTALCSAATPDRCYRFLAYYPVLRSAWVAGTSATSWRNPGLDTGNASTWILAEYRANMPSTFTPTGLPTTAPAVPLTGDANILSDYMAPTVPTPGFTTAASSYSMFSYVPSTSSLSVPVTGVTLNLAATRKTAGVTLRLPNATDEYTISVYPTNLGKIAAN